jgi:fructose-1,6-bisphosphatase/inositol monophosphatase family enzyme
MLNQHLLPQFEAQFKDIGNQIAEWRNDEKLRTVLEPKEFKTAADKKAHQLICNLIQALFGKVIILSEEEDIKEGNRPTKYWLIDPIDGTASWYNGFDGFVTQAAYIENDIPIYGIVYAPVLNKLWSAIKNKGAFLNGIQITSTHTNNLITLIDNYPEPRRIAKTIFNQLPIDNYIECGSLGLKSCMVADGTADLFVKDIVIRDWDIAPIITIMEELNGLITDLQGNKIELKNSFIKTNGLVVTRSAQLLSNIVNLRDKSI